MMELLSLAPQLLLVAGILLALLRESGAAGRTDSAALEVSHGWAR